MVLEALLNPSKAEKKPWELFLLGIIYSAFSLVLSYWVFRDNIGFAVVALTSICSVPLVYNLFKYEEEKDYTPKKEYWLLKEHGKAVSALMFLFLGFVTTFLVAFLVLSSSASQNIFSVQINAISKVSASPSGQLTSTVSSLGTIVMNNLKILVFCFVLSFFFGAGAIFVLTWNASILATAIGMFVKNSILSHISPTLAVYSSALSIGLLKYFTHGLVEILAYFIGALAGGILSIAVINHHYKSKEFRKVLLDSIDVLAVSIILICVAALIEVFVTPKII
jgi:uncharacterized membrane protein SpoIIM required for sporulation